MAGPRIFSLNPSRLYSSIGIAILLLASQGALAQYSLPKLSILVDNNISSIHLSKVALRMENKMNEDLALDSVDHTPFHLNTFFISPQGWIDSIYYYPTTTAYDKKGIYNRNPDGTLFETKVITAAGIIESRSLLEKTSHNEWYLRRWEHGQLTMETRSTADSITYQSILHQSWQPKHLYSMESFDFEKDLKSETWYEGEEIRSQKNYQWISENGVPKSFTYTSFRRAEGTNLEENERAEFPIDEEGNAINERNGTIFDPFRNENFYSRHERFTGISNPFQNYFTEDSLVKKQEISEVFTFDGTMMIYEYVMDYRAY
tara:strand:+ start:146689 stop:147639 length:951 start_codon:yes stop_codon:yes gene_type:complete